MFNNRKTVMENLIAFDDTMDKLSMNMEKVKDEDLRTMLREMANQLSMRRDTNVSTQAKMIVETYRQHVKEGKLTENQLNAVVKTVDGIVSPKSYLRVKSYVEEKGKEPEAKSRTVWIKPKTPSVEPRSPRSTMALQSSPRSMSPSVEPRSPRIAALQSSPRYSPEPVSPRGRSPLSQSRYNTQVSPPSSSRSLPQRLSSPVRTTMSSNDLNSKVMDLTNKISLKQREITRKEMTKSLPTNDKLKLMKEIEELKEERTKIIRTPTRR